MLLLTLNTWNNSENVNVKNAIVWPADNFKAHSPSTIVIPIINAINVRIPIRIPWYAIAVTTSFVNILEDLFGFLFIMFLAPSSSASANAGKLSVTKLIHNICIGKSGVSSATCPIPVIFAINPAPKYR